MIRVFCFFLFSFGFVYGQVPSSGVYSSSQAHLKVYKRIANKTYFSHIATGSHYNNKSNGLVKIGATFHLDRENMLSLSARNQQGVRHTDDWIKENSKWLWDNTSFRNEQALNIEHIYTKRLGFAPFTAQLRLGYDENFYNSQKRLIGTIGLNYFYFGDKGPLWSIHYLAPFYYALNFEKNKFYKNGHYLSILYHLSKKYQFGISYRQNYERWTASESFKRSLPNQSYDVTDIINTLGIEFFVRF